MLLRPHALAALFTLTATACTGVVSTATPRAPGAGDALEPGREFVCRPSDEVDPGPNLVRRLTVAEYSNTVQATLGVDISGEAVAALPEDLRSDGFGNTASAQVAVLTHIEAFEALADLAAERADVPALVDAHATCTDLNEACARTLIESLGAWMYRGPVLEEEVAALLPIVGVVQDEGDTFVVAAELILRAMLQSPRFLYRIEAERGDGAPRALDGLELASRLSYLLWNTSPDEALYAAAASGALSSDAGLSAEVARMLEDPRARAASLRYVIDWLDLTRLDVQARDPDRFPEWDARLGVAMREETTRLFEHLIWDEQRPLTDVFDAQTTFVSPELAAHYGLGDPIAGTTDQYDLSELPERGGLLTQGSMLAIGGDSSSMVSRGLFLLETFLCGHLDSPPPGADTTPPPIEPGNSQRSYSEGRVESPTCGGCHEQMEPVAWGLERFDAVGQHRLEDEVGNPLGQDGLVVFPDTREVVRYEDSAELMSLLASSDRVRDCMSLAASQYAMGRPMAAGDSCSLHDMRDRFAESEGTYQDLMTAIALSPGFRSIRTETDAGPVAP